ncbi:hypothetical protein [Corynebacterium sp. A21]|uniref:hypothetical protein n=1 Tax=Corynebacterium sp. A21 TaxID=3457318 RepID=UPI003FCFD22F
MAGKATLSDGPDRIDRARRKPKLRKARGRRWWPTRALIIIAFMIPLYSSSGYAPTETTRIITSTLRDPLINQWGLLRPITTGLLAAMVLLAFFSAFTGRNRSKREEQNVARVILVAYALFLLATGFLQNMSFAGEGDFTWVLGNTLVSVIVAVVLLPDIVHRFSTVRRQDFRPGMSWTLALGLLAFIAPYSSSEAGALLPPGMGEQLLIGTSGITYCFLTPVFLAVLLCFHPGIHSGTLSVIGFAGLGFGLFNMMTWFLIQPDSWWMGVLHLPLLILSISALAVAHQRPARSPQNQQPRYQKPKPRKSPRPPRERHRPL